jgi:hypothetical protein
VPVRRPLDELYLRDEFRLEPHAVLHLFLGQSPHGSFLFGKIDEWTSRRLQALELLINLPAKLRDKTVSYLCYVIQLVAFILPDD